MLLNVLLYVAATHAAVGIDKFLRKRCWSGSGRLVVIGTAVLDDDGGRGGRGSVVVLVITTIKRLVDEGTANGTDGQATSGAQEHALLTTVLAAMGTALVVVRAVTAAMLALTMAVGAAVAVLIVAAILAAVARLSMLTVATVAAVLATGGRRMISGSLPLGATGSLLYIVPTLLLIVIQRFPAVWQGRLVGRRVVGRARRGRRRIVLAAWRRGVVLARGRRVVLTWGRRAVLAGGRRRAILTRRRRVVLTRRRRVVFTGRGRIVLTRRRSVRTVISIATGALWGTGGRS